MNTVKNISMFVGELGVEFNYNPKTERCLTQELGLTDNALVSRGFFIDPDRFNDEFRSRYFFNLCGFYYQIWVDSQGEI